VGFLPFRARLTEGIYICVSGILALLNRQAMPPRASDIEEPVHQGTYLLSDSPAEERLGDHEVKTFSKDTLDKCRRLLYVSHFFNQFSENLWQFCLVLFLAAFSNYESLTLVCSYGLVSSAFVCYFGPAAGRFVDGTNRLVVARRLIGYENCAVLLATGCCCLLLSNTTGRGDSDTTEVPTYEGIPVDPMSIFLLVSIHILGAGAKILDNGFLVAVERDWVVVMSKCVEAENCSPDECLKIQTAWLSQTNVSMKQIDLGCKVVAPTLAGFFVAMFDDGQSGNGGTDLIGAAILVGVLNASALVVELACTARIYRDIPSLALPRVSSDFVGDKTEKFDSEPKSKAPEKSPSGDRFFAMPDSVKIYLDVDISMSGIGLSLL